MKECNSCHILKDDSEFYVMSRSSRGEKKYLYHICKDCSKAKSNPEYQRDWELKKKYGISLEEYRQESAKRSNRCDICNNIVKTLHVDHDHVSGKVRGYLCGSCNRALGLFKDSSDVVQAASGYLKFWEGVNANQ